MKRSRGLLSILFLDVLLFGVLPTTLIIFLWASTWISTANPDAIALYSDRDWNYYIRGYVASRIYPLELFGAMLLVPAFIPPAATIILTLLAIAIWRGSEEAPLAFLFALGISNVLEVSSMALLISLPYASVALRPSLDPHKDLLEASSRILLAVVILILHYFYFRPRLRAHHHDEAQPPRPHPPAA